MFEYFSVNKNSGSREHPGSFDRSSSDSIQDFSPNSELESRIDHLYQFSSSQFNHLRYLTFFYEAKNWLSVRTFAFGLPKALNTINEAYSFKNLPFDPPIDSLYVISNKIAKQTVIGLTSFYRWAALQPIIGGIKSLQNSSEYQEQKNSEECALKIERLNALKKNIETEANAAFENGLLKTLKGTCVAIYELDFVSKKIYKISKSAVSASENLFFLKNLFIGYYSFLSWKTHLLKDSTQDTLEKLQIQANEHQSHVTAVLSSDIDAIVNHCLFFDNFEEAEAYLKSRHICSQAIKSAISMSIGTSLSLEVESWQDVIQKESVRNDFAKQLVNYDETIGILTKQAMKTHLKHKISKETQLVVLCILKEIALFAFNIYQMAKAAVTDKDDIFDFIELLIENTFAHTCFSEFIKFVGVVINLIEPKSPDSLLKTSGYLCQTSVLHSISPHEYSLNSFLLKQKLVWIGFKSNLYSLKTGAGNFSDWLKSLFKEEAEPVSERPPSSQNSKNSSRNSNSPPPQPSSPPLSNEQAILKKFENVYVLDVNNQNLSHEARQMLNQNMNSLHTYQNAANKNNQNSNSPESSFTPLPLPTRNLPPQPATSLSITAKHYFESQKRAIRLKGRELILKDFQVPYSYRLLQQDKGEGLPTANHAQPESHKYTIGDEISPFAVMIEALESANANFFFSDAKLFYERNFGIITENESDLDWNKRITNFFCLRCLEPLQFFRALTL